MDAEENELYGLRTQMERVVGARPASTLMSHLSPKPWPDVATKADLNELKSGLSASFDPFATKSDLDRFATKSDLDRFATKSDLDRFATKNDLEVGLSRFESAMLTKLNQQTLTMTFALVTVVLAIASMAFFR